jgi:hypothetical protein
MLEDDLTQLLEPLLRRLVREEVERAKLRWRWASVARAAELLDVTPNALYIRISKGQLPTRKLEGKVYVDMEALDRRLGRLQ